MFGIPIWLIIALVVVIAVGVLIKAAEEAAKEKKRANPEHRYEARAALLTDRELTFLRVLDPMAADLGLRVCPQVRLEDVIRVPKGADNFMSTRNRIRAMHIDFVLVDPDTFGVYACIELQDRSHRAEKRQRDDRKKADALASAGVPLQTFNSIRELEERGLVVSDES